MRNDDMNLSEMDEKKLLGKAEIVKEFSEDALKAVLLLEKECFPKEWQYEDAEEYYAEMLKNSENINIFLKISLGRIQDRCALSGRKVRKLVRYLLLFERLFLLEIDRLFRDLSQGGHDFLVRGFHEGGCALQELFCPSRRQVNQLETVLHRLHAIFNRYPCHLLPPRCLHDMPECFAGPVKGIVDYSIAE